MTARRPYMALPLMAAFLALTVGQVVAQDGSASPSVAGGPVIAVTAHDYSFGGLPSSVPAGTTLTLTNAGSEVHQLIVARKNDGVTESFDELLALPPDEGEAKVTTVGVLFAAPGETAVMGMGPTGVPSPMTAIGPLPEGEYLAICFVPQGTTEMPDFSQTPPPSGAPVPAGSAAPQGPPHFLLGMKQEFTVTAAGSSPGPIPSAPAAHAMPAESPTA